MVGFNKKEVCHPINHPNRFLYSYICIPKSKYSEKHCVKTKIWFVKINIFRFDMQLVLKTISLNSIYVFLSRCHVCYTISEMAYKDFISKSCYIIINRPSVARAVLQTPSWLIHWLNRSFFCSEELGNWNCERMFTPHHPTCHVSHVKCHISHVTY